MVKKERSRIVNKTVLTKMLPQSYQTGFQHQLKATQYVTRQILVGLLQFYKQVSIERLANWLKYKGVYFGKRQKQGQYIQPCGSEFKRLESLGLAPGISCYLGDVKVTKQKGFNQFNIAAKWKRGARQAAPKEGWYILTNLESEKAAVTAYKSRGGIEAMFKDCQTGGYNLEGSQGA